MDPIIKERLTARDGSEDEFGPGEVSLLPPGHDAWIVGAEPVGVIDITGMPTYAKPRLRSGRCGKDT